MNSTEHGTEADTERPAPSAWQRRAERWKLRFEELQEQLEHYREWFDDQPWRHMATTMVIGCALLAVVVLVAKLMQALVTGIVGWFTADTPPPPPPEPASPIETAIHQLASYIGDLALQWSAQHPVGAIDPVLVPQLWLLIGAGLLLVVRSLPGVVLLTAWSAATVWTVYTATPAANPVPAALLAGGMALIWSTWWVLSGVFARLFR